LVQIKRAETEAELHDIASLWADERQRACLTQFGKTVEEQFGLQHGCRTLVEESRFIMRNYIGESGEAWMCLDRGGVLHAASVFQLRPEEKVVTFFHLWHDEPIVPFNERRDRGPVNVFRHVLLQRVLEDLFSRGYERLEMLGRVLVAGGPGPVAAKIDQALMKFDSLVGRERYRVVYDIGKWLEARKGDTRLQALLRKAEAM